MWQIASVPFTVSFYYNPCYYCCYYCAWLCGSEIPSLPYGVSVRPKEVLLGQTSGFAQLRDWRFRGGECLQLGGHPFPCVPRYTLWLGSSLISPYGYQKGIHSNFLSSLPQALWSHHRFFLGTKQFNDLTILSQQLQWFLISHKLTNNENFFF